MKVNRFKPLSEMHGKRIIAGTVLEMYHGVQFLRLEETYLKKGEHKTESEHENLPP